MYRIAVPDESSGRPERMYCHPTDSLRVVANRLPIPLLPA